MIKFSENLKVFKDLRENYEYPSLYGLGNKVNFDCMERDSEKYSIEGTNLTGIITGIRFTEAKVFYDIIDNYYGFLFRDVDSIKVRAYNTDIEINNLLN